MKGASFANGAGFISSSGRCVRAYGRHRVRKSMPWWNLIGVVITVLVVMLGELVDAMTLPPIHWNSSNPMFKASNNDHVIEVNIYDDIDFVCPHLSEESEDFEEFYLIHQVSKREYDDCNLYSPDTAIMIVNCSSPGKKKRFTILFEPFQSIPNVPEYHPGGRYHFISTSTGRRGGIANPHQGACVFKNMKLTIQVCCEPTTPAPPVNSTTVLPSTSSTLQPLVAPDNASSRSTPMPSDLSTTTPKISSSSPSSPSSSQTQNSNKSTNPKFNKTTVIPHISKPPDRTKDPDEKKRENEIDDPAQHVSMNRGYAPGVSQTLLALALVSSALLLHLRR